MLKLTPDQTTALRDWFNPERRHLIGLHTLYTGNGTCYVDRWPAPRTVLVQIGMLCSLSGDPEAVAIDVYRERLAGLLHAPSQFVPHLKTVFPDLSGIDRVIMELHADPIPAAPPVDVSLRRLEAADTEHLINLSPDLAWISNTWGGPVGLAASGFAWGAFVDGKLASLAGTFLAGDQLEDIGVVTEADYRGRGLAGMCAAALCQDVRQRGRSVSWTTSDDNPASIRVAEKLGFQFHGPDILYIMGKPAPAKGGI